MPGIGNPAQISSNVAGSNSLKRDGSVGSSSGMSNSAATPSTNSPYVSYTYLPPSPPRTRSPSPYSPVIGIGLGSGEHTARYRSSAGGGSAASTASIAQQGSLGMQPQLQRRASSGFPGSNGYAAATHSPQVQLISHTNGAIQPPLNGHAMTGDAPIQDLQLSTDLGGKYPMTNGHTTAHLQSPTLNSSFIHSSSPITSSFPFGSQVLNKATEMIKSQTSSRSLPMHSSHHPLPSPILSSPNTTSAHLRRRSVAVAQVLAPSISTMRFVSYCALWYTSSALSSNTGKSILNRFRYPVTLTFIQFGFVAGWCIIFCVGRVKLAQLGLRKDSSSPALSKSTSRSSQIYSDPSWGIKKPSRKALEGTVVMSLFQIAGHIFSSMAIARVPVSTVHTIKVGSSCPYLLTHAH